VTVHDLAAEGGGDDQRADGDELGGEELAVVGVTKVAEPAELPPRLKRAGPDDYADGDERELREARHHSAELVEVLPAEDDGEEHDEPAEPERDPAQVRDIGDERQRDEVAGARVPAETRCEQEPDSDDCGRGSPPLRQRILDERPSVHQQPQERERHEEQHEA
jgi:hypothetical protein